MPMSSSSGTRTLSWSVGRSGKAQYQMLLARDVGRPLLLEGVRRPPAVGDASRNGRLIAAKTPANALPGPDGARAVLGCQPVEQQRQHQEQRPELQPPRPPASSAATTV